MKRLLQWPIPQRWWSNIFNLLNRFYKWLDRNSVKASQTCRHVWLALFSTSDAGGLTQVPLYRINVPQTHDHCHGNCPSNKPSLITLPDVIVVNINISIHQYLRCCQWMVPLNSIYNVSLGTPSLIFLHHVLTRTIYGILSWGLLYLLCRLAREWKLI